MPELQLLTKEILKPSWGTFTGSWRLKDMDKVQGNWSMLKNLMKLDLFLRQPALSCTSTSFFALERVQMLWFLLHFWKYKACHKRFGASMWFTVEDAASAEHFFPMFPPTVFSYKQYYQYSAKKHSRHAEQEASQILHYSNCSDIKLHFLRSVFIEKTR